MGRLKFKISFCENFVIFSGDMMMILRGRRSTVRILTSLAHPPRHFVRLGTEGEPRHAVEGNRKKSKVVWSFVTGSNGFDLPNFDRSHFRFQSSHPKIILMNHPNESMNLFCFRFFRYGVHQGGVDPTKSPRIWVPAVSSSARVVGKWQLAMRWRTTCLGVINSSTLW